MAAITIKKAELLSRTIRSGISQSTRKINLSNTFEQQGEGLLNSVFRLAGRLTGFLSQSIGQIQISATQIYGWLVNRATEISHFDWNATDAELEAAIRARNISLTGTWGGVAGTILGQLVPIAIGAGVGLAIPVIGGPALASAVVASAGPEAIEEIWGTVKSAVQTTAAVAVANLTNWSYINIRKLIKSAPDSLLTTLFGESGKNWIKNVWGSESAPRLTFADALEDKVESIQNPYLRAFTDEAVDEFFDSFIESGFVVARSLDQAMAEAKAAQQQAKGPQRTVLITPDKRTPGMALPVTGAEEDVKQQIQATINHYRQIASKDVGQIVGQPAEDWYRGKPQRRKLTIVFKSIERPPYYRRDGGLKSATYTIPDPKTNLSWEKIKRAAKKYTWGKYRATANLDNGRQMAVYGATPQIAEDKLKELLELSEAEIITLSITEEKDRNPKLKKEPTLLYPAHGTMLVRRPALDLVGRTDLDGNTWDEEHIRFDLWCDDEPDEFELVRFGTNANS